MTLGELIGTSLFLTPKAGGSSRIFAFRLPETASQGPETWYLVRLNVSVVFAETSPPGSVLVSESVNGHSSAQVAFSLEEGSNGGTGVTWKSADLIRGSYDGRSIGRKARVKHTNYLLAAAVKGGESWLTFKAEAIDGAVATVEIGAGSGVYASPVGWVELGLEADVAGDSLRVGEAGMLDVTVANRSRRPAKAVQLSLHPLSEHLFVRGSTVDTLDRLTGTATRRFVVGSSRPGTLRIGVVATEPRTGERATTVVAVRVGTGGSGLDAPWRAVLVTGLLGVLVIATVITRRREAGR